MEDEFPLLLSANFLGVTPLTPISTVSVADWPCDKYLLYFGNFLNSFILCVKDSLIIRKSDTVFLSWIIIFSVLSNSTQRENTSEKMAKYKSENEIDLNGPLKKYKKTRVTVETQVWDGTT